MAANQIPPSAPVGVDAPGSRAWMAEVCRAAALSLAAHGVRNDQLSKVADWIDQQPAPSAPAGVEGLIEDWESDLAEDKRDGVSEVAIRVQEIHLDQLRALSQQPAAVDEVAVKRAVAAVMSAPAGISVETYVRIVLEAALTGEQ